MSQSDDAGVIAATVLQPLNTTLQLAVDLASKLFQEANRGPIDFNTNKAFTHLWRWLHARPSSEEAHNQRLDDTVVAIIGDLPSLRDWATQARDSLRRNRISLGFDDEERCRQAGRLALKPHQSTIASWETEAPHLYLL
ncbi:MAG: hypothetical protein AAB478_03715 [Patescibacteria group bacterium]